MKRYRYSYLPVKDRYRSSKKKTIFVENPKFRISQIQVLYIYFENYQYIFNKWKNLKVSELVISLIWLILSNLGEQIKI